MYGDAPTHLPAAPEEQTTAQPQLYRNSTHPPLPNALFTTKQPIYTQQPIPQKPIPERQTGGGGAENHFSRQYAEVWNSIDDQLKNIENTKQFAKELKKWLLSQQANRR